MVQVQICNQAILILAYSAHGRRPHFQNVTLPSLFVIASLAWRWLRAIIARPRDGVQLCPEVLGAAAGRALVHAVNLSNAQECPEGHLLFLQGRPQRRLSCQCLDQFAYLPKANDASPDY